MEIKSELHLNIFLKEQICDACLYKAKHQLCKNKEPQTLTLHKLNSQKGYSQDLLHKHQAVS